MAAQAWQLYHNAILRTLNGGYDFDTHVFKCALLTAAHTPDLAVHDDLADVVAEEVAGGGDYARQAVGGITLVLAAGVATFDCNDIDFGDPVTITAKYAVIYDDTHAADGLFAITDLNLGGGSVSSVAGPFLLTIHSSGVFRALQS